METSTAAATQSLDDSHPIARGSGRSIDSSDGTSFNAIGLVHSVHSFAESYCHPKYFVDAKKYG